jgi:RNA polymerase sigma-70 factor (ECF subfamily)
MRQTEGCSFEEIARVLGTSESSVRGILSKARKRIIEQIKQS